ncbi:MAG: DUF427 domain-containing protein [Nocardioidaceae bacterium]|nr:DUF427 domain-containing protein [Nocardioidaceae bacterium]MDQ3431105.1 DUF427 domain-containing protein [Actinomycetota bacterium]
MTGPLPYGVVREKPGPGQESVWDYPRPPALEPSDELVEVVLGGVVIASTRASLRVLETSHPPTYYLPISAYVEGSVRRAAGGSWCEWKGQARYFDLIGGDVVAHRCAWGYPTPTERFSRLLDHLAVYPAAVDEARVEGQVVRPQPGGFYGGWITDGVAGPFKGVPGSTGW